MVLFSSDFARSAAPSLRSPFCILLKSQGPPLLLPSSADRLGLRTFCWFCFGLFFWNPEHRSLKSLFCVSKLISGYGLLLLYFQKTFHMYPLCQGCVSALEGPQFLSVSGVEQNSTSSLLISLSHP